MEGRGRDRQAEKEMETERHKQTHIDQLIKEWAEASEWSELQFKGKVEINQVQNLGRSHSMQRVKNVKGCKTWRVAWLIICQVLLRVQRPPKCQVEEDDPRRAAGESVLLTGHSPIV